MYFDTLQSNSRNFQNKTIMSTYKEKGHKQHNSCELIMYLLKRSLLDMSVFEVYGICCQIRKQKLIHVQY